MKSTSRDHTPPPHRFGDNAAAARAARLKATRDDGGDTLEALRENIDVLTAEVYRPGARHIPPPHSLTRV